MHIYDIKNGIKYTLFYNNFLYLCKINREKNNQKKSDFFRESKIARNAEQNWKIKTIPSQPNLERICDYFNKWLYLSLTPNDLVHKSLPREPDETSFVKEPSSPYSALSEEEKDILKQYRKLSQESKDLLHSMIQHVKRVEKHGSKKG